MAVGAGAEHRNAGRLARQLRRVLQRDCEVVQGLGADPLQLIRRQRRTAHHVGEDGHRWLQAGGEDIERHLRAVPAGAGVERAAQGLDVAGHLGGGAGARALAE